MIKMEFLDINAPTLKKNRNVIDRFDGIVILYHPEKGGLSAYILFVI